jgi:hypothetical protein
VDTTAVSFAQQVGTSGRARVTLENTGTVPAGVSTTQLTGAGSGAFTLLSGCHTIPVAGSCGILIAFSPTTAGSASAALVIQSNGSPSAITVALNGQAVAAATWTTLTNAPQVPLQLCFLLTDATVMCQAGQDWYRLSPTNTGSYVEGTWSAFTSFPSSYVPVAYASAVLADGRLAIIGGEYTGTQASFTLTNMGMIFDPVANGWQVLQPPPSTGTPNHWQCIGDAPATVLADGRWVIGSKLYQDVAVLDPVTLSWSQVAAPGRSDASNAEEGWTLLPDGSVLTLDVGNAPLAERLVLASGATSGAWVPAGPTLMDLHTPTDVKGTPTAPGCPPYTPPGEMGPTIVMPGGNVFAVGANGRTAIYSPTAHSWATGPSMPDPDNLSLNVQDGPAAILPSGHVLFGASPGSDGLGLVYFEFDGTQLIGTLPPVNANEDAAYFTSLLPLPTGQVLFVDGSMVVQVYTPAASPTYDPSWAPTITTVPTTIAPGSTYQISGTQLNGLTQGSAYGDESQNATNYPLVRITNQASGHVLYARTHDHSSMGIATGAAVVSTSFDVPAASEPGASTLQVVANGIPSAGVTVTVTP